MIKGIQYEQGMNPHDLVKADFACVEYRYIDVVRLKKKETCALFHKVGLVITAEVLFREGVQKILTATDFTQRSYLVIETVGLEITEPLYILLKESIGEIEARDLKVYIENGYILRSDGEMATSPFSKAENLQQFARGLNQYSQKKCVGVCLHIGYVNLFKQNVSHIVEALGDTLQLMHMSDNDGVYNHCQLPYTFTKGRGTLSTDWYGLIGALTKQSFQGMVVLCQKDLFAASPPPLYETWYQLLQSIMLEWEEALELEQHLQQCGCRILFGAGRMFDNYMEHWGEAYPPAFTVDNNEALWGTMRRGIEIKSPQEISAYEQGQCRVFICNMFYEPVTSQLDTMGVSSYRYNDKYYGG